MSAACTHLQASQERLAACLAVLDEKGTQLSNSQEFVWTSGILSASVVGLAPDRFAGVKVLSTGILLGSAITVLNLQYGLRLKTLAVDAALTRDLATRANAAKTKGDAEICADAAARIHDHVLRMDGRYGKW